MEKSRGERWTFVPGYATLSSGQTGAVDDCRRCLEPLIAEFDDVRRASQTDSD
jgi:hypothetical protein